MINISDILNAAYEDGIVANADQIKDTSANKLQSVINGEKADKVITVTVSNNVASWTIDPNKLYIFGNRTSDLTLSLGTQISGIANEYHFIISTGATAPTINWPTFVVGSDTYLLSWNGGSAPTIAANKVYEVSILNGKAAFMELDPNTLQS